MNKAMHLVLKALSDPETKLDLQKSRRIMNLKILDPFKPFYRTLDTKIYNEGREVPVRIYFPNEESYDTGHPLHTRRRICDRERGIL